MEMERTAQEIDVGRERQTWTEDAGRQSALYSVKESPYSKRNVEWGGTRGGKPRDSIQDRAPPSGYFTESDGSIFCPYDLQICRTQKAYFT